MGRSTCRRQHAQKLFGQGVVADCTQPSAALLRAHGPEGGLSSAPPTSRRQFRESNAATYQYPNKKRTDQIRWTGVLSSRLLAEVGGSLQHGPVIAPERPEVQHGDIPTFDSVTQTHMVARPTYNWNPQYRAVQHSSLSYVTGDHDVKVGYQFNRGYINQ